MDGDEHSGCFMKHNIMGVEFCSGVIKEYLPMVLHWVFWGRSVHRPGVTFIQTRAIYDDRRTISWYLKTEKQKKNRVITMVCLQCPRIFVAGGAFTIYPAAAAAPNFKAARPVNNSQLCALFTLRGKIEFSCRTEKSRITKIIRIFRIINGFSWKCDRESRILKQSPVETQFADALFPYVVWF